MIKGTYSIYVDGFDYGCAVTKASVTVEETMHSISKTDIQVKEVKKTTDWSDATFSEKLLSFDREVLDVYFVDEKGEKCESSNTFVIEMREDPNHGSPFTFSLVTGRNSWCDPYELHISMEGLDIDPKYTKKETAADCFIAQKGSYEGVEYDYAYYKPEKETSTLVVWLHGGGEGGVGNKSANIDVYTAILGNRVTALAQKPFQDAVGGAYILAPQCPTYWIDKDGKDSGIWEHADGTSFYKDSLIALIDDFAQKIQAKKIVITGCSNGGYMSTLLAKTCADKYTSYVHCCAPMDSNALSEEDIQILKDLPMYYIYAKDDDLVDPEGYEVPVLKRLKEAGADKISVSITDSVIDQTGKYSDAQGNPYKYSGHWSWIHFFNNYTADQNGKSVFEWIADSIR